MIYQPYSTLALPLARTRRAILATLLSLTAITACTTRAPSSPVPTRIASHPFDVAWDDRAIFREGLIGAEQAVLDQLSGATVYHIDLQISGDFLLLQGREEVRYTNQEDEPLDEVYFRLFPNIAVVRRLYLRSRQTIRT